MISGSILVLASIITLMTRYIVTAILSNGQSSGSEGTYEQILSTHSFSTLLLLLSNIIAIVGVALLVWGALKNSDQKNL